MSGPRGGACRLNLYLHTAPALVQPPVILTATCISYSQLSDPCTDSNLTATSVPKSAYLPHSGPGILQPRFSSQTTSPSHSRSYLSFSQPAPLLSTRSPSRNNHLLGTYPPPRLTPHQATAPPLRPPSFPPPLRSSLHFCCSANDLLPCFPPVHL